MSSIFCQKISVRPDNIVTQQDHHLGYAEGLTTPMQHWSFKVNNFMWMRCAYSCLWNNHYKKQSVAVRRFCREYRLQITSWRAVNWNLVMLNCVGRFCSLYSSRVIFFLLPWCQFSVSLSSFGTIVLSLTFGNSYLIHSHHFTSCDSF